MKKIMRTNTPVVFNPDKQGNKMAPTKARRFILKQHFKGLPKPTDFELQDVTLPELKTGEILTECVYMSVDPYMRPYSVNTSPGSTMIGGQVARVVESRTNVIPIGCFVFHELGWATHCVTTPINVNRLSFSPDMPVSYGLSVLGMPGMTAYFGLKEICMPKPGETVLVTSGAGAVGSIVGQLAKIEGCHVIGFAGTDDKVRYMLDLGFDQAFNYKKTVFIDQILSTATPNGIDCYFDNVGGSFSSAVLGHMTEFGRIAVCGCVSTYNAKIPPAGPFVQASLINKQLKMEGFLSRRWRHRFPEGLDYMEKLIRAGRLKVNEHVTDGFENIPAAFIGVLKGENIGKALVRVKTL